MHVVHIAFAAHVPVDSVSSMLTGLGGTGSVRALDETQRRYEVQVLRDGRVPWLKKQLGRWEQYGFLTYQWVAS